MPRISGILFYRIVTKRWWDGAGRSQSRLLRRIMMIPDGRLADSDEAIEAKDRDEPSRHVAAMHAAGCGIGESAVESLKTIWHSP
jgi:hypothetical protein